MHFGRNDDCGIEVCATEGTIELKTETETKGEIPMTTYKLMAIDIDDTLINDDKEVTPASSRRLSKP